MTQTYNDFACMPISEKVVLCHIEPAERLLIWEAHTEYAVYKRLTDYFVIDIKIDGTSLTEGSSDVLGDHQFWYDPESGYCYVRMDDDSDPNTKNVVAIYRQFFSNLPINLPYDLISGYTVPYLPYIKDNSSITKALDEEQTGIAIETATRITLDNTDGFFDDSYDTLFFENKTASLYSWGVDVAIENKRTLFVGEIQDKTFSPTAISFSCKDFMYKLRGKVVLPLFSESDGSVSDTNLATPKRRIYGLADGVKCVPIDNTLDGYTLTGTVSIGDASATLTGVSTLFLDQLSPADTISVTLENEDLEVTVESVESNTSLTLTESLDNGFDTQTVLITPARPWRKKNRNWSIAGHKLRAPATTVASATQSNRMTLTDGSDIFDGDSINIDGYDAEVKRIDDNKLVLRQGLPSGTPSGGEAVTKNPVSKAYINKKQSYITSDWTLTNTTEAILNFTNLAEFNIAPRRVLPNTVTFTASSRTVTTSTVNFLDYLKPRDWIQSDDITHTTWYEILSVEESSLSLRIAYAGSTQSAGSYIKTPELIGDETLITVNCIGYESAGAWVKTAADAVNHLLSNDSVVTNINSDSFDEANSDCNYALSMVIPEETTKDAPIIKDVITKINESVFGSLVSNVDYELVYSILTPEKPATLEVINQHDIIGEPTVRSRNEIIRKVNLKYRPFTDRFTGDNSFLNIEYTSDFVDDFIGSRQEKDITVYLYNELNATIMAQRLALYNSLSQSTVTIKGKLNLSSMSLNDKIYIYLDRIYKRFGGRDRRKIGIVNKVTTNGTDSTVEFNDFANIFNRVMSIAPDSANDFTAASNTEKIFNAYVCDDDLEVPDITSDQELGTNLVG